MMKSGAAKQTAENFRRPKTSQNSADAALARKHEKITDAIEKDLPRPTFGNWESLINTFCKHSLTHLSRRIDQSLSAPVCAEYDELRDMIPGVAGELAVSQTVGQKAGEAPSPKRAVSLLRLARNVMTAHGPLTERAAPEVYVAALKVVLDVLGALPWESVDLFISRADGMRAHYRGCLPALMRDGAQAPGEAGIWLSINDEAYGDRAGRALDISTFFLPVGNSIALYASADRLVDPISGRQFDRAGGEQ